MCSGNLFSTLSDAMGEQKTDKPFDISDEEFADDIMKEVSTTIAVSSNHKSGESPIEITPTMETPSTSTTLDQKQLVSPNEAPPAPSKPDSSSTMTVSDPPPKPQPSSEAETLLAAAQAKIDTAIKAATTATNPAAHLQTALDELSEDSSIITTLDTVQHQQHQIHSLQYLCNALIRNAKLAEKMTRVVNAQQVTKAVNRTLLMENMDPTHLSLTQFLQHPMAAPLWTIASIHDTDFVNDGRAWGRWWMSIVEAQVPRQRLRRVMHQINQFNHLAISTFTDFGHNPTKFTTEWLVIQLTRLGDHLLAANIKTECGFNWPYTYQKVAGYIARNKLTEVREIFIKIDPIWPAGVRMNFHYGNPPFNDCVLALSEQDTAVGKIPAMKKMRHAHDKIFGGPNVGSRTESGDIANDTRDLEYESDFEPEPPRQRKRQKVQQETLFASDNEYADDEPRSVLSYADLLKVRTPIN